MRAGIGLLSILIVAAIIFYVAFGSVNGKPGYVPTVLNAGKQGRDQANQLGGKDENGMKAEDSIVMEEIMSGSELRRLKVVSVVAGGPMQAAYGLQPNDEIIQANQLELRGMDPALAKSWVITGYAQNQPLIIERNGQSMTLTPDTAITRAHPREFGKPGVTVDPNSAPALPKGQPIPTH